MRPALLLLLPLAACAPSGTDEATASPAFGSDPAEAEAAAEAVLFGQEGAATEAAVEALSTLRVELDDLGVSHVRVQQLAGGVPVWGGEAIVHFEDDGTLFAVTNDLVPYVVADTTPDYAATEAIELAAELYDRGMGALTAEPTADLWVLPLDGVDHLAWRVQLSRVNFTAGDALPVVFVDAHTGEYLWGYDNLQSATCTGSTNFYGSVSFECYTDGTTYYLENPTDLLATYTWNHTTTSMYYASSTSTVFSSASAVTVNAVEAQYVSKSVDSYYAATFGRNGIDGAGGPAAVTSHGYGFITSSTSYSSNYVNAFWDPTGLYMTYGDGDGVSSGSLTTLDIGGHEMTHGVTQYTANLTYSGEPGGLNESMSDVFGAMVERSVLGASSDVWLVGEDTWTPSVAGDALRYMADPAADGVSKDYYSSTIGSTDVHYSSGVANLAFYLLSEGGSHPRGKSTTVVTGIGADKAAQIWYLALTSYMTSSTSFSGARTATLSAASSLYGATSTEYTQVGNAWTAVGVAGAGSCSTASYSGTSTKKGKTVYAPSSSGTAVTVATQTVSMTGTTAADFDLYLEVKSGRSWSTVATSATSGTSTESISYSGSAGTYRVRVYNKSAAGSYAVSWCK